MTRGRNWYATHPKRTKADSGGKGNWKIVCRKTRSITSEYVARLGSYVVIRQDDGDQFRGHLMGRVMGRVNEAGDGKPLMVKRKGKDVPGWWLDCIVWFPDNNFLGHRYISPDAIEAIIPTPTALARFFFAPELPDRDTVLALERHGSLSNDYVAKALERIGPLRVSDGDVFGWALNDVDGMRFQVAVAKAAKLGRAEQKVSGNGLQDKQEEQEEA